MPTRYVFTPVTKNAAHRYDGLTLNKDSIRITRQAAGRLAGVQYVQLGYDTKAKAICLRPVKYKENRAAESVYKLGKGQNEGKAIACKHLSKVMPRGRYRFAKTLSTGGLIFVRDGDAATKQS